MKNLNVVRSFLDPVEYESYGGLQPGRGKRGGIRVVYYAKVRDRVLFMLTLYAKNEEENIPAHILRKIREEIDV